AIIQAQSERSSRRKECRRPTAVVDASSDQRPQIGSGDNCYLDFGRAAMGHIRVRNIGKAYKRYAHKWGRLAEWVGTGSHHQLKWVVRDLTFDVRPGEAVGIIGFNGAGKSTLLKIIAGTTRATTGTV